MWGQVRNKSNDESKKQVEENSPAKPSQKISLSYIQGFQLGA